MKKLILILLLFGCTQTHHIAQVSWKDFNPENHMYDLYLVELDKIVIVDTVDAVKQYYVGRLTGTSFIFESAEGNGKMVLVGIRAVDTLKDEVYQWNFSQWAK